MNKHLIVSGQLPFEIEAGLELHRAGDFFRAEVIYRRYEKRFPNNAKIHYLLGILGSQTNRPSLAKYEIEKYLKIHADDYQALGILGLANFELGNYHEARRQFIESAQNVKEPASVYFNLGQTNFKLGLYQESIDAYRNALSIEPNNVSAHIGIGISLRELKQIDKAHEALLKAISINPSSPLAHFLRGNVLRDLGELKESVSAYTNALKHKSNYIEAAINCGNSYKDLGLATEAIDCYNTALKINPSHPEANYNKSLALLNDGQLEEGWPLYEWRFNSSEAQTKFVQQPLIENIDIWNGETLHGNLLVLPEQGIGDQVFFLGMLPDLQQRVKSLTVGADSRLTPLLRRTYPEIDFIQNASDVDTSRVNAQIHMGSLGQHLRRNENSFSTIVCPYLMADKLQSAALRQSMKAEGKLLCGISWLSKNADHGNAKSLSLAALKDALTLPGFDFVDLQYGDTQHEREQFHADHGVHVIKRDEIDNFKDIDGLASLIDACDLVITVSNTTAHLACALGKPTLVLLPQSSAVFWYWLRKGMQSPWYPTAVMLRQEELGGWPQVVGAVRHILQGMQ